MYNSILKSRLCDDYVHKTNKLLPKRIHALKVLVQQC